MQTFIALSNCKMNPKKQARLGKHHKLGKLEFIMKRWNSIYLYFECLKNKEGRTQSENVNLFRILGGKQRFETRLFMVLTYCFS